MSNNETLNETNKFSNENKKIKEDYDSDNEPKLRRENSKSSISSSEESFDTENYNDRKYNNRQRYFNGNSNRRPYNNYRGGRQYNSFRHTNFEYPNNVPRRYSSYSNDKPNFHYNRKWESNQNNREPRENNRETNQNREPRENFYKENKKIFETKKLYEPNNGYQKRENYNERKPNNYYERKENKWYNHNKQYQNRKQWKSIQPPIAPVPLELPQKRNEKEINDIFNNESNEDSGQNIIINVGDRCFSTTNKRFTLSNYAELSHYILYECKVNNVIIDKEVKNSLVSASKKKPIINYDDDNCFSIKIGNTELFITNKKEFTINDYMLFVHNIVYECEKRNVNVDSKIKEFSEAFKSNN